MGHLEPRVMIAVEAPAGLHSVSAQATTALVPSLDATVCVVADGSASWGLGVEAAALSLQAFVGARFDVPSTAKQLGSLLEECAFRAQEDLAERDPEADTLFAATMLVVKERRVTCAWVGDALACVADASALHWLNHPNHHSARATPSARVVPRPVHWYPGLLGCTQQKRSQDLLEYSDSLTLNEDQVLIVMSEAVWSKLDEVAILDEIARTRAASAGWRSQVHENLLRAAKLRGARGHRVVAGVHLANPHEPRASSVWSRAQGYRAVVVQESDHVGYVIEERHSAREVVRVKPLELKGGLLTVEYSVVSQDINQATACALIFELVLQNLMGGKFDGRAEHVLYRDAVSRRERRLRYAWPWT